MRSPAYLAMSYLYKRSNRLWHFLIKHDLVSVVWRPLVEFTRWRHLRFRRRLAAATEPAGTVLPALPALPVLPVLPGRPEPSLRPGRPVPSEGSVVSAGV